jgi:hypothetical protein
LPVSKLISCSPTVTETVARFSVMVLIYASTSSWRAEV